MCSYIFHVHESEVCLAKTHDEVIGEVVDVLRDRIHLDRVVITIERVLLGEDGDELLPAFMSLQTLFLGISRPDLADDLFSASLISGLALIVRYLVLVIQEFPSISSYYVSISILSSLMSLNRICRWSAMSSISSSSSRLQWQFLKM